MMNAIINRTYNENETLGGLYVLNGHEYIWSCKSIELPWLGNQHKISCIPAGTYEVVKFISPAKGNVFLLKNVPDRDAIEIHAGNFASGKKVDTMGCILPGAKFLDINKDGNLDVIQSTETMKKLWSLLPDEFKLTII